MLSTYNRVTRWPRYSEPQEYMVLGKRATKNEYNVAMALDKMEYGYLFQVTYWGGRSVIGGQVLDFLVFLPAPIPVQVYGEYWHTGQLSSDDRYNEIQIANMVGQYPVILWGSETETVEDATSALKRKVL